MTLNSFAMDTMYLLNKFIPLKFKKITFIIKVYKIKGDYMKRLFTLLFMFSVICPTAYVELHANDSILNKEMRDQITQTVKSEVIDNQELGTIDNNPIPGGLINVIFFRQDISTTGDKYVSTDKKECIAIAIDDAWAVASKKCQLSKGDKISPLPGEVETVSTSNFRIIINNRIYKVDNYETKNLILLRAVNENGNPLFSLGAKPQLAYVSANYVHGDDFLDGSFEVNRTDRKKAAYDDSHGSYEDNFHPYYGVGRTNYPKTLKSFNYDKNTQNLFARISTSWIGGKELRAGDPLFYIENGKRYLLGFANAVNLWDNFSNTRTDKVLLFTDSDIKSILDKIGSVDPEAQKRIRKNVLAK